MSAEYFEDYVNEPDIEKAFNQAVEEARHEYGYNGYTGTIAEKKRFKIIHAQPIPKKYADALIDEANRGDNPDYDDDKLAPAHAIRVIDKDFDGWIFFGWSPQ